MSAAENGWMRNHHGTEIEKMCEPCGRSLYVTKADDAVRCDGCGDPEAECFCPDTRELA